MRVRKKKNGAARFEAASDIITTVEKSAPVMIDVEKTLGKYGEYRLEIGCGKGAFAAAIAEANENVGFLAMELVRDVIIFAAEKAKAKELQNLRFVCANAEVIEQMFPEKSFDVIYINFCDPWPKARHAKRRLTSEGFLRIFKNLIADDGKIEFKTDNIGLFEFSLEEFPKAGYEMKNVTFDLHASEWAEGNIQTEYERNFSAKGFKINRLEAYKQEK